MTLLETQERTPGSMPLKNARYEALARERAAGATMADAWRAIGRDPAKSNNQARVFRRPEVAARVEFLRGEWSRLAGLSLIALQARLLRIADANAADLFEIVPGREQLRLCDITKLSPGAQAAISELEIEERVWPPRRETQDDQSRRQAARRRLARALSSAFGATAAASPASS